MTYEERQYTAGYRDGYRAGAVDRRDGETRATALASARPGYADGYRDAQAAHAPRAWSHAPTASNAPVNRMGRGWGYRTC